MNYVGMDLHSDNTYMVVVNQAGRRVFERRLPNELGLILARLAKFAPVESVAVESTYNYYWLTDGLLDAGYRVRLANPLGMKPYAGLKRQDDRYDAGWMAELQRLGILPTGHLYGRRWRGVRDLLRQRSRWVRERTGIVLSLQGRVARCRGVRLGQAQLLRSLPDLGDPDQNLAAWSQAALIEDLNRQIEILELRVAGQLEEDPIYRRLTAIAGIGPVLASTIRLESGDLSRFARVGKYASYARATPASAFTNHKLKGPGNRRCGNRYLGWAYHEAAHCMNRCCPILQRWRRRKTGQGLKPRAVWSAMAHKICRGFYFVMRDGVEFSPLRLFG